MRIFHLHIIKLDKSIAEHVRKGHISYEIS